MNTTRKKGFARILIAAALVASTLTVEPAFAGTCAGSTTGGEWRNYGQDLANTRNQPDEHLIRPANVASLEPDWIISSSQMGVGVSGGFHNTPIVVDGCLYLGTQSGWVVALNADSGAPVWKQKFNGDSSQLVGDPITGSVAVGRGKVYVGVGRMVSNGGPFVRQMDQATGALGWASERVVDTTPSAYLVTGPQLFYADDIKDANGQPLYPLGLLFQGFMGGESQGIVAPANNTARGGYAIIDAATGAIVAKDYTISDDEYFNQGFRGASIWGTAAIDQDNLYAYAPTGNPATAKKEAPKANSIVKIDVNPARSTFGRIVAWYHGLPDNYVAAVDLYDTATCQTTGSTVVVIWAQACGQMDLDFGGAPSLFADSDGTPLVGDLQKAGVFHAIRRSDMTAKWTATVGTPQFPSNSNSSAVAGGRVFTAAQFPGQMVGLSQDDGFYQWLTPMPDGLHYNAVSTANGVVYTGDSLGNLRAFDAVTGLPLLVRNMTMDAGSSATDNSNSSGIAIARNTVYYPTGSGFLAAYRLP